MSERKVWTFKYDLNLVTGRVSPTPETEVVVTIQFEAQAEQALAIANVFELALATSKNILDVMPTFR